MCSASGCTHSRSLDRPTADAREPPRRRRRNPCRDTIYLCRQLLLAPPRSASSITGRLTTVPSRHRLRVLEAAVGNVPLPLQAEQHPFVQGAVRPHAVPGRRGRHNNTSEPTDTDGHANVPVPSDPGIRSAVSAIASFVYAASIGHTRPCGGRTLGLPGAIIPSAVARRAWSWWAAKSSPRRWLIPNRS